MNRVEDKSWLQPMRRAATTVAVLGQLRRPYSRQDLRDGLRLRGIAVTQSALALLLRRLEERGLIGVEAESPAEQGQPVYRITERGLHTLGRLSEEWNQLNYCLTALLAEDI